MQLFPNPARDRFMVLLNTASEKLVVMNLYDQEGRLLESKRVQCAAGVNNVSWDIRRYAAGTYFLSFGKLNMEMTRIVKQ